MHARMVTFQVPPDRLDDAVAWIRENTQWLPQHEGFQHGHWMYDRERGVLTSVVLFDTSEQADAAWAIQGPRVRERMAELGATPEIRSLEVVHNVP